jgi:hypothetical protein
MIGVKATSGRRVDRVSWARVVGSLSPDSGHLERRAATVALGTFNRRASSPLTSAYPQIDPCPVGDDDGSLGPAAVMGRTH